MNYDIVFHQLYEPESSTYTYLIADKKTKEAAIIDPVLEMVDRDLKLVDELGLKLKYILDTHIHADHITAADEIRKRTSAKTAVSVDAEVPSVDIPLQDGQELNLGEKNIKVIATPGHTNTCLTFKFQNMIFTGDALLIRGCGRTDFQQGSSDKLYDSVQGKLFALPDETIIFPGHDYRGHTSSSIGEEKKYNPRLSTSKSKVEFGKIMAELKLANPKKIHEAVPANVCARNNKRNSRNFIRDRVFKNQSGKNNRCSASRRILRRPWTHSRCDAINAGPGTDSIFRKWRSQRGNCFRLPQRCSLRYGHRRKYGHGV